MGRRQKYSEVIKLRMDEWYNDTTPAEKAAAKKFISNVLKDAKCHTLVIYKHKTAKGKAKDGKIAQAIKQAVKGEGSKTSGLAKYTAAICMFKRNGKDYMMYVPPPAFYYVYKKAKEDNALIWTGATSYFKKLYYQNRAKYDDYQRKELVPICPVCGEIPDTEVLPGGACVSCLNKVYWVSR